MSSIKEITYELIKRGFCIWQTHENTVSCFDILARRDTQIFVLKFYKFIESITKENAGEIKNLAVCLSAYLLVLAESSKNCPLNDDVLYSRYNIAVVTYETFKKILDEEYPLLYSTRGNYCAEIDEEIFSDIKAELNLTLDDIAEILHVSKQAVYRYETQCRIPQNVIEKFSGIFGKDIIKKVKISKSSQIISLRSHIPKNNNFEMRPAKKYLYVADKLSALGFLTWEGTAAFNILAINTTDEGDINISRPKENRKKEDINFLIVSNDFRVLSKRANFVEEITEIIPGICICVGKYKPGKTLGKRAKFIKEMDLRNIETKEEFIEIAKE
ncbi:MAG: hypothetical protein BWK75_05105 [Candidatus Altiarchaeales archaeon A3]|nr:MAG: hypothetical protein BWK75_05105 [Candidatus Altiarchaeales archaeon A3]